jgi:aryl-alcohol dehydrogenase-like predicted oxidoreductase
MVAGASMIFPRLCLGGNVFGWTADERESFAVLDRAREAGLTFIDTADTYTAWANGGVGGQSETIIGKWLARGGARDDVLIATKVGADIVASSGVTASEGVRGIRPENMRRAIDGSLRRLGTDYVDIYYAHVDDGGDLTETFAVFDELARAGKIRMVGISNFLPDRLRVALDICEREGLTRPTVLQPQYSLMERGYEYDCRDLAARAGLAVFPYFALARGFLTGKYRDGGDQIDSPRSEGARAYLAMPRGRAVLAALDSVAQSRAVPVAAVSLAWARAQPTITAPTASARTVEQLIPLIVSTGLELTRDELDTLDAASRLPAPAG